MGNSRQRRAGGVMSDFERSAGERRGAGCKALSSKGRSFSTFGPAVKGRRPPFRRRDDEPSIKGDMALARGSDGTEQGEQGRRRAERWSDASESSSASAWCRCRRGTARAIVCFLWPQCAM